MCFWIESFISSLLLNRLTAQRSLPFLNIINAGILIIPYFLPYPGSHPHLIYRPSTYYHSSFPRQVRLLSAPSSTWSAPRCLKIHHNQAEACSTSLKVLIRELHIFMFSIKHFCSIEAGSLYKIKLWTYEIRTPDSSMPWTCITTIL